MSLCRASVWLRESAAPAITLLMSWLTSDSRCSSDSISAAFCFASCGKEWQLQDSAARQSGEHIRDQTLLSCELRNSSGSKGELLQATAFQLGLQYLCAILQTPAVVKETPVTMPTWLLVILLSRDKQLTQSCCWQSCCCSFFTVKASGWLAAAQQRHDDVCKCCSCKRTSCPCLPVYTPGLLLLLSQGLCLLLQSLSTASHMMLA
jgi:hypothetical protein